MLLDFKVITEFVWWLRELNTQQLKKTNAKSKAEYICTTFRKHTTKTTPATCCNYTQHNHIDERAADTTSCSLTSSLGTLLSICVFAGRFCIWLCGVYF